MKKLALLLVLMLQVSISFALYDLPDETSDGLTFFFICFIIVLLFCLRLFLFPLVRDYIRNLRGKI
jgi:hypothetical protein